MRSLRYGTEETTVIRVMENVVCNDNNFESDSEFLPRDAMPARSMSSSVRPSVCHKSVFYQNG